MGDGRREAARRRPVLGVGLVFALVLPGCGAEAPPFSEGPLQVNGTELYVARAGAGEPVLVVHGGPLMDHGYLRPWLLPLEADRELVYFDQRLSGRSAGTVDSASVRLDTLVTDIEGIRTTLGLERVHVLGHSWGGLLALRYAVMYPDRVASLVLVSPMAPSAELWAEEESELAARVTDAHQAEAARLRAVPGVAEGDTAAIAALLRHAFRLQLHDPSLADSLRLHVPSDYLARSARFAYLGPDLSAYDFRGDLEEIRAPTLILFGEDEPGAGLGGAVLENAIPGATLVRIPEAGHFAFMERPDAFQREVRRFWDALEPRRRGPPGGESSG